jgi:hypothetical protein
MSNPRKKHRRLSMCLSMNSRHRWPFVPAMTWFPSVFTAHSRKVSAAQATCNRLSGFALMTGCLCEQRAVPVRHRTSHGARSWPGLYLTGKIISGAVEVGDSRVLPDRDRMSAGLASYDRNVRLTDWWPEPRSLVTLRGDRYARRGSARDTECRLPVIHLGGTAVLRVQIKGAGVRQPRCGRGQTRRSARPYAGGRGGPQIVLQWMCMR